MAVALLDGLFGTDPKPPGIPQFCEAFCSWQSLLFNIPLLEIPAEERTSEAPPSKLGGHR